MCLFAEPLSESDACLSMSAKTFSSPHSPRCQASGAYDDDEAHFLAPASRAVANSFWLVSARLCADDDDVIVDALLKLEIIEGTQK